MRKGACDVVFLIGAGRSGTTLLYKILSIHRSVSYLSNYQSRYPKWPSLACLQRPLNHFQKYKRKSWFKEYGDAYFNEKRRWFHSIVPTPSEAESVYTSCGIPLRPGVDFCIQPETAECLQNRFERIGQMSGGQVLLTKRTDNNLRIPILKDIFPEAKYIHLVRDGRAVAHSLPRVGWWNDHILFWADKSPRQMVSAGSNPLELAAQNWTEEMQAIERGIALVQSSQVLEVRYDEILQNPNRELQRILDFMEISDQENTTFWDIVDSLHLEPKQETWIRNWSEAELNMVLALQADTLRRWGFETDVGL